jgi:molybdopterin synthase sulfur carrier subunit
MANTPSITVLYFAQVAELAGLRQEIQTLAEAVSGTEWLEDLEVRYPQLAPTARLKIAINQRHAPHQALIQPGDEVAVFEPVTGG